jgi:hypothetical protein
VKLYTGKKAVQVVSEGLEMIGGNGYIEDTGLPRLLRDTQVLTIWEGTTNILALDVLRALKQSYGKTLKVVLEKAASRIRGALDKLQGQSVADVSIVRNHALDTLTALADIEQFAQKIPQQRPEVQALQLSYASS